MTKLSLYNERRFKVRLRKSLASTVTNQVATLDVWMEVSAFTPTLVNALKALQESNVSILSRDVHRCYLGLMVEFDVLERWLEWVVLSVVHRGLSSIHHQQPLTLVLLKVEFSHLLEYLGVFMVCSNDNLLKSISDLTFDKYSKAKAFKLSNAILLE